jgi:hypothetical protein
MTISELCIAAHKNAVAHGFYCTHKETLDVLRNKDVTLIGFVDHAFQLASIARMHAELAEAADAVRGEMSTKIPDFLLSTEECADLVIRILDHCGNQGHELEDSYVSINGHRSLGRLPADASRRDVCQTFPQLIAECHYHLGSATEALRKNESCIPCFAVILHVVNAYYYSHSIDELSHAITAKMTYNESRPYKHGKVS